MSFAKFFKDALLPVAVWTCGVLLSCFVLTVAGAPVSIVVVAVGVSFIFGMLGIVIEYARRRRFLRQLERAAITSISGFAKPYQEASKVLSLQ